MERRDELRAGDSDRERVGERLRAALDEGRLNLMEYDERLQQAYSAKTYGELDKLLADLPAVTPAAASQVATTSPSGLVDTPPVQPGQAPRRRAGWIPGIWGTWLTASLITTGVWFATSLGNDERIPFWPIWVIVPFGAVCLAKTIRHLAGEDVSDGAERQRREERRARRDRRRGRA